MIISEFLCVYVLSFFECQWYQMCSDLNPLLTDATSSRNVRHTATEIPYYTAFPIWAFGTSDSSACPAVLVYMALWLTVHQLFWWSAQLAVLWGLMTAKLQSDQLECWLVESLLAITKWKTRSVLIGRLNNYVCMYYMLCDECQEIHPPQFHHAYLKGACNLTTLVTGNSIKSAVNNCI